MTRLYFAIALGLSIAAWMVALAAYAYLPEKVPIHWNIRGEVDGYGHKAWAAFITPALMVGLLMLFRLLPWLSPKPFTLDESRSTYEFAVALTMGLMVYTHVVTLWAAWQGTIDLLRALMAGLCLFFVLLGNVLGKVRRNFFLGVRTPWTLANERVWIDTHRLAARLFVAAGLIGFALCLMTGGLPAFVTTLVLILLAALVPAAYSLVYYKRLERQGLAEADHRLT